MRCKDDGWDRQSIHSVSTISQDEVGKKGDRPPRPKRLNLRQCKTRTACDYNSIDDLSPEYTVLPFVKRLKILNERQKIVELQRALTVVGQEPPGQEAGSSALAVPDPQLNPWFVSFKLFNA